jgi:hypothetical protein
MNLFDQFLSECVADSIGDTHVHSVNAIECSCGWRREDDWAPKPETAGTGREDER